jgi:hypothetical protein
MNVTNLVRALNRATEGTEFAGQGGEGVKPDFPKIILRKVEHQTAYVEIANDQYLTESMGSAGAQDWLAGVTYTLTENRNIKAVNFSFTAGEHAMPGVYTRENFKDYKIATGK